MIHLLKIYILFIGYSGNMLSLSYKILWPQHSPVRWELSLVLFYRQSNWGSEGMSLVKVMHLTCVRTLTWAPVPDSKADSLNYSFDSSSSQAVVHRTLGFWGSFQRGSWNQNFFHNNKFIICLLLIFILVEYKEWLKLKASSVQSLQSCRTLCDSKAS